MEGMKKKVFQEVDKRRDEIIISLQELVRIPSVVGKELAAQNYMARKYKEIGLELDIFEADYEEVRKHPASPYADGEWVYRDRPNVVATLAGSAEAKSLILNGHIDVVSPEPIGQWKHDPWSGQIEDGKIYGRGALDMKAGLMANFFALKCTLAAGVRPKGTVVCESVIEEEAGGGGGTLACFLRGHKADGMIITEPVGFQVILAHPGIKFFRIKVEGKPAHGSLAHKGVNAVGKAAIIYDALVKLDEARGAKYRHPMLGKARSCHVSVGKLNAGDWLVTVAGWAVMEGRLSYIPGEKEEDVRREFEETVMKVAASDSWLREHPPKVEWIWWQALPWLQDDKDPFVQKFINSATAVLGVRPPVMGSVAGLDNRYSKYFGTPSVAFGPLGQNFHALDEYVEINSVIDLTKVLAASMLDWCGCE